MAILISPFPRLEDGNREKMEKGGGIRFSSSPTHLGRYSYDVRPLTPTPPDRVPKKMARANEVMREWQIITKGRERGIKSFQNLADILSRGSLFPLPFHPLDGLGQSLTLPFFRRRRHGLICTQAIGRPPSLPPCRSAAARVTRHVGRRRHLRAPRRARPFLRRPRRGPPAFPLAGVRLPARLLCAMRAGGGGAAGMPRGRFPRGVCFPLQWIDGPASFPRSHGRTGGPQRRRWRWRRWPMQSLAEGTNKERKVRMKDRK